MTNTVTSYRASSGAGVVRTVDFSTVGGRHYSFLELHDPSGAERIKSLLAAAPLSQTLVTSTYVDGRLTLIMCGNKPPSDILAALALQGEALNTGTQKKPFDAWKVRSYLGFAGQLLQLVSSFLRPDRRIDTSVFVFAASNLAANAINLKYDEGEKINDVHRLRYLKQQVNRDLSPHLNAGSVAPGVDDHRQALRPHEDHHKPIDKAKGFLEKHSVGFGELGLRYLGAVGLVFPARYWKSAWANKTLPKMDSSPLRVYTGLSSIVGKTVALTAEIPDPYNPKPRTWLDHIREKFSFLFGGLIEVTSFSALAYDCFYRTTGEHARSHRGLKFNGKLHADWLGGIGASLFTLGYIVRSWAKYGERKVDMAELYAHASDTLAQTPPEKMPQLLANTAAGLAEHFKEQPGLNFAAIYTHLASDLQRFHASNVSNNHIKNNEKSVHAGNDASHNKLLSNPPHPQVTTDGAMLQSPMQSKALAAC